MQIPFFASLFAFYIPQIGIVDKNGNISPVCLTVIIILGTMFLCFTGCKNWADKLDDLKRKNASEIYHELLVGFSTTKMERINQMCNLIIGNKYKLSNTRGSLQFGDTSRANPKSYLNIMLTNFVQVLATLYGTSTDDVGISLAVMEDDKWHILCSSGISKDLPISIVANDPKSTFFEVKDFVGLYRLYLCKDVAYKNGHYMPNAAERNFNKDNLSGSIYCANISLTSDDQNFLYPAVLTVTTYKSKLCLESDTYAVEKVLELFRFVENEIKDKLLDYYFYKHIGIVS